MSKEYSVYCPICGVKYSSNDRHRCNESTLKRIDQAHASAELEPQGEPDRRSEADRISEGFKILKGMDGA